MDVNKILKHSTKKPQSILKIVLGIAVIMLVMWMFLISKMEVTERSTPKEDGIAQTESLKSTLLQKETEEQAEAEVAAGTAVQPQESKNMFQKALPTFVGMMVILGGIWIWAKRKDNSKTSGKDVREVGDYVLGQGAQLKFVEINNEVWVLGLTAGNVNLLHRVPKGEWTDEHTQSDVTPQDFKSFYNLLKN